MVLYVEDDELMMLRRPNRRGATTPRDEVDHFRSPLGQIRFIRDERNRITQFSLSLGRVFDIRFHRLEDRDL